MSQYDSRKVVKYIRRQTRRTYFAEENIRIVLDGLRGEASIAGRWCREGMNQNVYQRWSKAFLWKPKNNATKVTALKQDNDRLRPLLAGFMPKNDGLEKSVPGADSTWEDECADLPVRN